MKWWIGAAVLLGAGFVLKLGLLVYATYILAGMLLLSRFLARAWMNGLVTARRCSAEIAELGDTVGVEVSIANGSGLKIPWLLAEDILPRAALVKNPPALEAVGSRLEVLSLRPGGTATLEYRITCKRRGYYQIGPLVLETGDLLGLHRRYRIAAEPAYLMVLPRVVEIGGYDIASPRPLGEIRVLHRHFEDPTLIAGIKAYEPGQPLNRVHWRASARMGELQTKVFQPSAVTGVTIVLDFHEERFAGHGGPFREDLAIVAAGSIARALLQQGQRFGLFSNGTDAAARIRREGWSGSFQSRAAALGKGTSEAEEAGFEPVAIPPNRGEGHFQAMLESLARLELSGVTLGEAIGSFSSLIPRNTTVVAIVSAVDATTALALGSLRRRGYQVAAVVIAFDEPALTDWARRPEWVQLLVENEINFHRVENDASLRLFCSSALSGA